ncbi:accessory Sec system translocase SecA2 [Corynebacterium sp. 3HC-13]|uniref:accessory Sec system translocase SecA2 n=1 Tax=Corynebacterium poyangense TaxID=2684405 RepID=UPI001CC942C4|nr:accessory Sec system translocase SecA2 [Corynebacterium poyangense]MBZ8177734.1 accessory Sec system translocase SecA2 [Corynebacterium poyangense]
MAGFDWFWRAMGGSSARKNQKRGKEIVAHASEVRRQLKSLSDDDLRGQLQTSDMGTKLAVLAEAAQRTLGLDPFDCQVKAVLHLLDGDVIQMATGEGKTLVGAMAAVGFVAEGKKVHILTVNDYLARRDSAWMSPLVDFFGLSVGAIYEGLDANQRRQEYLKDIVYGPVNEIGFDVLRDRQVTSRTDQVHTAVDVALVDEADSVLVDEALVPLVLAGSIPGEAPTGHITDIVRDLRENMHYVIDDDRRNVFLTDAGADYVAAALGLDSLYDGDQAAHILVHVNLALHAKALLIRDIHYLVRDGKIQIIDSSRGRIAELQRWPDGLQAAVEVKEGLSVSEGGKILDTITIQALMGRYATLCGMTGTAVEATDQLRQFYDLGVAVIERHKPLTRFDEADRIYATAEDKNRALVAEIRRIHDTGQPVLVGTHDVAESEALAAALSDLDVNVLNAKNDDEEARIIAEAGDVGRITVSTQMAGRGTDIRLGGADESRYQQVVERGGLAVIGTGRHKTARLDNQLRGRAGRQGDPGLSLFFVSLHDDMVVSGGSGEHITAHPDAEGRIDQKRVDDFIAHCQRVTEGQLLEIHAQTWKYNKLLTDQRAIIDERRARLLDTDQAWKELQERAPERAAEVKDRPKIAETAREIMLFHLDEEWSEHLSIMDEVRESIHLRAVAKETPLDEFHRIAVREFKDLAQRAVDKAVETFQEVTIDPQGVAQLADQGRARPSATWTYMVSDNPLASGGNSVMSGIGNIFR